MTAVQPRASNFTPCAACARFVDSVASVLHYNTYTLGWLALPAVSWSTIGDRLRRATPLSFLKTRLVARGATPDRENSA